MRSGSTLLCDLMSSTKRVGTPQEFFLKKWEEKSDFDSSNYPDYVYKTLESFSSDNGVSGVKLMWVNFNEILRRLRESQENPPNSDLDLLHEVFPNLQFIFISRKNKVRQAISLARSVKSKLWNKSEDPQNKGKASFNKYSDSSKITKNIYPYISPGSIEIQKRYLEADEAKWMQFFQEYSIQPCTILYEELAAKKHENISKVFQFMDISLPEDFQVNSSFKKQSDIYTEFLLIQYHIYAFFKRLLPDWLLDILNLIKSHVKNVFNINILKSFH